MTVIDFVDLDDEINKVEYVDLTSEDANVEENHNAAQSEIAAAATSAVIKHGATATTSLSMVKQVQGATASLSMTEHGAAFTSSKLSRESTQPENKEFLIASEVAKEAVQSGNEEFVATDDCVKEATQSKNAATTVVSSSIIGQGATGKSRCVGTLCQVISCSHIVPDGFALCISNGGGHSDAESCSSTLPCTEPEVSSKYKEHSKSRAIGNAGNAMGGSGTYNNDAQEQLEGDTEAAIGAFSPVDIDDDDDEEVMMHHSASPIATEEVSMVSSFPVAKKDVSIVYVGNMP